MDKKEYYERLGKILVSKLRDENFQYYLQLKEYAQSISLTEYLEKPRNPNYAPELQQIDDDRFKFLNSLDKEQSKALDQLILSLLDNTAFNFLREVEENLHQSSSVGITVDGLKVEEIQQELLSGTLFGEYLLWIDKNSKHGPFQH